MTTAAERIAAAIAEEYADLRDEAPELALQFAAMAEADGIPLTAVTMWIHDRPQHELSGRHWRAWCRRYRIGASHR